MSPPAGARDGVRTAVVFGAAGQLGGAMTARLASRLTIAALTRQDVDLADPLAVRAAIVDRRPAIVINCAAFNNVDAAEDQPVTAFTVNAMAVGTMARAAADIGGLLVHYSSDFVFDGTASRPYTEDDLPEPQSVYAQSKLLGEWLAADAPRHYVLRVESLFGSGHARSSVDRIIAAVREGRDAPVFVDRITSPSYVDDVVAATDHLMATTPAFGVYHCVNSGHAPWSVIGHEIARLLDRPATALRPVEVSEVALKARRPRFAALSNAKLASAGFTMPTWQDALARYLERR